jgi:hypothetical protein
VSIRSLAWLNRGRETELRVAAFTMAGADKSSAGGLFVKRMIIAIGLGLAIASSNSASAQMTTEHLTATDGNASALGTGDASAAPGTVTRGGKGASILGPDGTYNAVEVAPPSISVSGDTSVLAPPETAPAPEAAPVYDEPVAAAPEAPVDAAVADTAVSSGADLDGDNIADDLEPALGLDPTNIDTDGDGVADGDELNIYGTDPLNWDSDGDGVSDGDELYNTRTDPLVWNDFSADATGGSDTAAFDSTGAEQ